MEKPQNKSEQIRQIGDFLPIDENGYIKNELSPENIQEKWRSVADETVSFYRKNFGDRLVSVYLRGSVAKGLAIDNVSDVDNFAVVDLPRDQIDLSWASNFKQDIAQKYPFVGGVEVGVYSLEEFKNTRNPKMFAKTQSLLVFGQDLTKDVPNYQIGRDVVAHGFGLKQGIEKNQEFIESCQDDYEKVKSRCRVMMKRIVRVGMETVMVRTGKYTRDLYLCWQEFSKYYPEKSDEMRKALELAVEPTDNVEEINRVFNGLGNWLVDEFNQQFS